MWTNEKNKEQRRRMFHGDGNKENTILNTASIDII